MAIYHLSVKTVGRASGRSATGAAAYRAACLIVDELSREVHDYTRKSGVESATIILPDIANIPEWALDRSKIWNAAEQSETRKNSTVAREFEIALPAELSPSERQRLALDFAHEIVAKHGCFADVSIHAPGGKGDNLNHHAHILISTRRLTQSGFSEKTRELDDQKMGKENVLLWRERFSVLQNERLQENGFSIRVDHRSLKAQGIDREPTQHLGPSAVGFERRTGEPSNLRIQFTREAEARLLEAKRQGELERQIHQLNQSMIDLSDKPRAAFDSLRQQQAEAKRQAALLDFMLPKGARPSMTVRRLFEGIKYSMRSITKPHDEHPEIRDGSFCLELLKLNLISENDILLVLRQLSEPARNDENYAKDRLQKAVEKLENAELASQSFGLGF